MLACAISSAEFPAAPCLPGKLERLIAGGPMIALRRAQITTRSLSLAPLKCLGRERWVGSTTQALMPRPTLTRQKMARFEGEMRC